MSAAVKPWHDSVACAMCGLPVVVPAGDGHPRDADDVRAVRCAACGYAWPEDDDRKLAQVWWSAGAHAGRLEKERAP